MQINAKGKIFIRAPYKTPKSFIENFVGQKLTGFNVNKRNCNRNEKISKTKFRRGIRILLFEVVTTSFAFAMNKNQKSHLTINLSSAKHGAIAKLAIIRWYKEQAKNLL